MIDITKEDFFENRYNEISKTGKERSKIKDFIIKYKILTTLLISLGILMIINTILIYNFFRILSKL